MVAGARSVSQYLENVASDRILCVLPFSFDAGFSQLTTAFRVGACAVLMDYLLPRMEAMVASGRHYVLCGDWNIAHRQIDLRNWRSNQKNSGFLPEERAWLDRLYDEVGMVDTFRHFCPDGGFYTWWRQFGGAREKNVGWRIDYVCVSEDFVPRLQKATIHKEILGSDHCPVGITFKRA